MPFRVRDVTRDQPDQEGNVVRRLFIKIDALYAVYATDDRVTIQFADDQAQGAAQRKSMAALFLPRGTIDSLLNELRDRADRDRLKRADRYERRLADALTLGLQGQSNQAALEMEALKRDLIEERRSSARQTYLGASVAGGAGLLLLIAFLSWALGGTFRPAQVAEAASLWFAAAIGVIGAFFSSALAVRARQIEPGISFWDTAVDASLRLFVGAVSGGLLYALIQSGAFGLTIGSATVGGGDAFASRGADWLLLLLVAFIAGFLERLVPEMLARVSATDAKTVPAALTATAAAEDAASDERHPLGPAAPAAAAPPPPGDAADDPEADEDDCCDRPGAPELLTEDIELPETVGGVAPARIAA